MKDTCTPIEPLLAAYTLGALEASETAIVEEHLVTCKGCQRALADYQAVSDALLASHPPREPRASVRKQLLRAISPGSQKNYFWQSARRLLQQNLMPALALAGVLILALISYNLLDSMKHLLDQQTQLVHQLQAYQTALNMAVAPDTRVTELDGEGIRGSLIFNQEDTTAVLNISGLKDLPENQTYQVWLIRADDSRVSGGTFKAQDGYTILVIHSPENLLSFSGLGVTIEPAGGSPGPTGPRVLAGNL